MNLEIVKIALIGDVQVQKRQLMEALSGEKSFNASRNTTFQTTRLVNGKQTVFQFQNIIDSERDRFKPNQLLKDANLVLICCDLRAPVMMSDISIWRDYARQQNHQSTNVLIGCGAERSVYQPNLAQIQYELNLSYLAVSASNNFNLSVIHGLATNIYQQSPTKIPPPTQPVRYGFKVQLFCSQPVLKQLLKNCVTLNNGQQSVPIDVNGVHLWVDICSEAENVITDRHKFSEKHSGTVIFLVQNRQNAKITVANGGVLTTELQTLQEIAVEMWQLFGEVQRL